MAKSWFNQAWVRDIAERAAWTFAQAFVVILGLGLGDVLDAFQGQGLEGGKAAALALLGGASAAGISAVKNWWKNTR